MKIEVYGIEALLKKIEAMQKKPAEIKPIVKKHTSQLQTKAQRYAPVNKTDKAHAGYLKRNISIEIKDGGMTGEVKSEAINKGFTYSYIQEYGGRLITAQPYMRPAFYEQKDLFVADLENLIKR